MEIVVCGCHTEYMSKREYIKNLTIGQSFIVDASNLLGTPSIYVVESIFSEAGKTVVGYTVADRPDVRAWSFIRPSLTLVTLP